MNDSVRPPDGDSEIEALNDILCSVFTFPRERGRPYLESAGLRNARVALEARQIAGGMVTLPMGQWFGGNSVPCIGIAAVGIAPEFRARGVATRLLRAELEALHAASVPISSLYPATQPVYRRLGYEIAGTDFEARLSTAAIDVRDRAPVLRRAEPNDESAIRAIYSNFARRTHGNLDRSEFFWGRVREWRGEPAHGYVVCRGDVVEGYLFHVQKPSSPGFHMLQLTDWAVLTPAAGRRFLTFFADHRSQHDAVSFDTGPGDPLLTLLTEQSFKLTSKTYWMMRIVHVAAALTARGYPDGLSAEVHLDVNDDVLPGNHRRYVLTVERGGASVASGGRGSIRVDIRGLAALYSSYLSPHALRLSGYLDGPDEELHRLAGIFAGPAPWMRDNF